jgi:hypothetical protein
MPFLTECILADLAIVERRIDRARKEKADPLEVAMFERMKATLEQELPIRALSPQVLNREPLRGYALLTDGHCSSRSIVASKRRRVPCRRRFPERSSANTRRASSCRRALKPRLRRCPRTTRRRFSPTMASPSPRSRASFAPRMSCSI